MPSKPKPKKVGRPKLPKGEGKEKLLALRLHADLLHRVSAAAQTGNVTVSEWIRIALEANLNG